MVPDTAVSSAPSPSRVSFDRRQQQRFCPPRSLTAQIELAETCILARVQNLSARGVALLTDQPFAADSRLSVRLTNASATFSLVVTIRVVYCRGGLTSEQFLGCEFDQALTPGEIGPFLV